MISPYIIYRVDFFDFFVKKSFKKHKKNRVIQRIKKSHFFCEILEVSVNHMSNFVGGDIINQRAYKADN